MAAQSYDDGKRGITLQEIEANPPLQRIRGAYEISRLDIVRISGYYDIATNQDTLEADPPADG